jgi:hypothetical protein
MFDVSMYGSLCAACSVAAIIYALEFRAHRNRASDGARRWPWHGSFFICMVAGFAMSALKSAFYSAYKWQQKAPDRLSAPKLSQLVSALNAQMWTVYAWYRIFKPLCFTFTLAAKVLILNRMLSIISVGRSSRARQFFRGAEVCSIVFTALSSLVTCILMFGSSAESFAAAAAFARAADNGSNDTAVKRELAIAVSKGESSTIWNSANNSFEVGFYIIYLVSCAGITAAVFHTMRAMLQSIEAQKLFLDDIAFQNGGNGDDAAEAQGISMQAIEDASRQLSHRSQSEQLRLVAINDAADHKSKRLRDLLRKVALNCIVVVITTLFGSIFKAINAAQGMLPSTPPPPCPPSADACDACELKPSTRLATHFCARWLLLDCKLVLAGYSYTYILPCHTSLSTCMQLVCVAFTDVGEEFDGLDVDILVSAPRQPQQSQPPLAAVARGSAVHRKSLKLRRSLMFLAIHATAGLPQRICQAWSLYTVSAHATCSCTSVHYFASAMRLHGHSPHALK